MTEYRTQETGEIRELVKWRMRELGGNQVPRIQHPDPKIRVNPRKSMSEKKMQNKPNFLFHRRERRTRRARDYVCDWLPSIRVEK